MIFLRLKHTLGPFLSKPEVSTLFDRYAITLPATQVCSVSCELPIATSSILPMKAGGCISIFQKRLFWVYDLPRVTRSLSHLVRTRTRVSGLGALPVLCTSRWTVPRPCLPFPEIQNSRPGIILSHLTALGYWVPFFGDLQHILICMLKTVTVFLSQSFKIKTFKSTHIPTLVLEPCTNFPPTSVHGHIWQRLDFCSLQQNDFYHFSSQHTDVLGNAVMSV